MRGIDGFRSPAGWRRLAGPLLAALVAALPLRAEPAGPGEADRGAIQAVISSQIEAFRRDDGEAAFAFASPTIRGMFGTAEVFMAMVRESYRPVYRPREVRFEELIEWRGRPTQRVLLVGPEGQVVVALYEMERQPDGSWKINGCYLLAADEKAT